MHHKLKRRLVIGTTTLAAAAFAGGAYAASRDSSTNSRRAFLDDVASRLHVSPQQLSSALQGAFDDQLSAAVKSGKLTQGQADAIRRRIQQHGVLPLLGPRGFALRGRLAPPGLLHLRAPAGPLAAAAHYLGLTDAQLFDQLRSGKSLAQVAQSKGKSVAGLKSAMTRDLRSRLDQAVARGMLSKEQEQRILSRLSAKLDRLIDRAPAFPRRRFFAPRGMFRGGPGLPPGPPPPGAPAPPRGP